MTKRIKTRIGRKNKKRPSSLRVHVGRRRKKARKKKVRFKSLSKADKEYLSKKNKNKK